MAHAEESTSKRKTLEIEKEETEELKQKYLVRRKTMQYCKYFFYKNVCLLDEARERKSYRRKPSGSERYVLL